MNFRYPFRDYTKDFSFTFGFTNLKWSFGDQLIEYMPWSPKHLREWVQNFWLSTELGAGSSTSGVLTYLLLQNKGKVTPNTEKTESWIYFTIA